MNKVIKFVTSHKKEIMAMVLYVGEKMITDQINKHEIRMAVKEELEDKEEGGK